MTGTSNPDTTLGLCWRKTKKAPLSVIIAEERFVEASRILEQAGVAAQKSVSFASTSFWEVEDFPMDGDEQDLCILCW